MHLPPRMPVQSLGSKTSCALNRRSENVVVKAIIIPELELCNVKMQVLFADVVEGADDTALEDAPEALNRLSVDRADNVLMLGMVNGAVVEFLAQVIIADPLIGTEQANLVRHGFVDESLQGFLLYVFDDASDHVSLASNSSNNNRVARGGRSRLAITFFPMAVLRLAA